jgi:methionyl-tRNA formyltransferase
MSKKLLIFVAGACLVCAGLGRTAKAQEEAYTAMGTTSSDTGGKQVQFNFTITKWATQDEIKQLGAILKDKGQDALLEELKKMDSGRINQKGDTGNQIAIAEKWQDGSDTVITLIAARRMSMFETKSRGVSTKYPFGFLQVKVNDKGEGSGKLVAAAKIKYDKEKETYRLDPFGNGATPVTNVRPLK